MVDISSQIITDRKTNEYGASLKKLVRRPCMGLGHGVAAEPVIELTAGSYIETDLPSQCKSCKRFIINNLALRSSADGS